MRLLVLVLVGRAMLASEHTTAPLFSRAHCHWGRLTTQGNASHGDCHADSVRLTVGREMYTKFSR